MPALVAVCQGHALQSIYTSSSQSLSQIGSTQGPIKGEPFWHGSQRAHQRGAFFGIALVIPVSVSKVSRAASLLPCLAEIL